MTGVEDVDGGGVARPQLVLEVAHAQFVDALEVVEPATDLDDPASAETDLAVVQIAPVFDGERDATRFGQVGTHRRQAAPLLLGIARVEGGAEKEGLEAGAAQHEHLAEAHQVAHLVRRGDD